MQEEHHIITDCEAHEAELKRTTRDLFRECGEHVAFIENHPILRDATYTEILRDSRGAFKKALAGRRIIGSDPYGANAEIGFALMHLKSQREMLERLMAQDADLKAGIAAVGADAKRGADAAERVDKRLPTPRADKGKKHTTRKNRKAASVGGVKFTAAWLAGVLNKSRFQPEIDAGWMGTCTTKKIEQWDCWCSNHPGEENGYGYRTELRTDAGMYDALLKFIENWDRHWKDYKAAFTKWRKTHANNPRKAFRFRPMRRTDIDTARMGRDEQGGLVIEPRPDPRRT